MRNRWFHAPTLHTPSHGSEKKVSWLELFYDLIFVAAIIQLGNVLADHVGAGGFAIFAALFVPLWVAWAGFTFFMNRFELDDFAHRVTAFAAMFSVGGMAIFAPRVMEGEFRGFALSYATTQATVALMHLRSHAQEPSSRDYSRYWGGVFAIGAVLWGVSVLFPAPYAYGLWALGVVIILSAPMSRASRALQERFPIDNEHLSERFGLLTIIVLGESFVKVLSDLASAGASTQQVGQASAVLLITCCLWWIYFDDIGGSRVRQAPGAWLLWFLGHLPVTLGITAVGVALKKAVHFHLSEPPNPKYAWLLAGSLALTLFSVAIVDSVTERRQSELSDRWRVNARVASGALVLVLAPAAVGMNAWVFLVGLGAVCVGQVLFDMAASPLQAAPETHATHTLADEVRRSQAEGSRLPAVTGSADAPVRKGAPSELRNDLYVFLVDGSWTRLFLTFTFVYLVANVFFAALYVSVPASLAGPAPVDFAHAFFFSVQTMTTIGYGAWTPDSPFADWVVTLEAAVGVLGTALATGLVFAKVSRPQASALFTSTLTVHPRDGVPTLHLRLGNARGNDVVDANISLTVVRDEITREGEHMRRLTDLALVRSNTPLFRLTWTVMHVIDEQSPLFGVDLEAEADSLLFIAVVRGHDGTYAQTTHARHLYRGADVRVGQRFVDVVSRLPDGRMMVDYERFHDLEPFLEPGEPG
ncbi:MAG: low temperature requirement protein A [Sandaracinaceae bacterium]|nr:low temperature requirement protein A [Myxococcales bacterium]MCB9658483.1 low temperature requirement protein A [Sandaracinaceae bacterium]